MIAKTNSEHINNNINRLFSELDDLLKKVSI